MHVRKGGWRNVLSALFLVTFALPLATAVPTSTVSAQGTGIPGSTTLPSEIPSGCTPSTATATGSGCIVSARLSNGAAVAFNPLGASDTATFVCEAGATPTGTAGALPAVAPACYDVQATAQDATGGGAANIIASTCAGTATTAATDGTVTCATPITPVGTTTTGYTAANTVQVSINESAPHVYTITFTGYILASCPAGFTYVAPTSAATPATCTSATGATAAPTCPTGTTLVNPVGVATAAGTTFIAGCRFEIQVQKKYVEITTITLTPNCPPATLTFAEGLKAYFGPACPLTATVSGTVVLKTGVNCAEEPPATGGTPPADFGPNATYQCVNGSLSVTGVAVGAGVQVTFTPTGPGSFTSVSNLGTLCAGSAATPTITGTTNSSGVVMVSGPGGTTMLPTLCPTGPGSGTVQACVTSTVNTQPSTCSNTITFSYTLTQQRAVPYVRWAGEKIVLTKCFGIGMAGFIVEFALKGNNPGLNATLLPTGLTTPTGTSTADFINGPGLNTTDTVWAIADGRGCASVIGYADGEGAMFVDAAVYSTEATPFTGPTGSCPTTTGCNLTTPIVNEHAFEVYYLKFDHLDIENITFQTYQTATALGPFTSFISGINLRGATVFPTSFSEVPNAPGTGETGTVGVNLCNIQYVRAMVHGYFEYPGDPSGRPASVVAIPGAPTGSAGSYTLPAGRWVLPEDWPLLATFAGFGLPGQPGEITPSSIMSWDLNNGWIFNPGTENPIFCVGNTSPSANGGVFAPPVNTTGDIPMSQVDLGPCISADATGQIYATAGPSSPCVGFDSGETVGIGPFDATQECTMNLAETAYTPLTYAPAGGNTILATAAECGSTPPPCLGPTGPNSTYLPNGTLNEWDAPMPPAQISFGITSGPGYLDQVNKTGLYAITFSLGPPASQSGGVCPTGYHVNPVSGNCELEINPNPFYAEAIPASPAIPPVTNNGGYLWNSWNFSMGITGIVSSTPAFAGVPAGGFVPGQSTSVTGAAPLPAAEIGVTVRGGTNLSACTVSGGTVSVTLADVRGFMPGMGLEAYGYPAAATTLGNGSLGTITSVTPVTGLTGFPNAGVVTYTGAPPAGLCAAPGDTVFIGTEFGIPVANAAAYTSVSSLSISTPYGGVTTAAISRLDTTNNIVYLTGAEAIAGLLADCAAGLSRPTTGPAAPTCEPAAVVPAGSVISTAPAVGAIPPDMSPPHPYPFWQWVPSSAPTLAAGACCAPTSATVYSDNHGEAVVSLNANIPAFSIALPASGTCPTPYGGPITTPSGPVCLLKFSQLGVTGYGFTGFTNPAFKNVATLLSNFSASKPGCIQTFASGTATVLVGSPTTTPSGPPAGQICINKLGGIEFGASAILGGTTIQAIADYPYTRGEHPPIASAPLTKLFQSGFTKSVTVAPNLSASAGNGVTINEFTVTVTALDICGNPITGEPVNVYVLGPAGAAVLAPTSGTVVTSTGSAATLFVNSSTGTATLSLEILPQALGTGCLVIKAVWPFESVERFATVPGVTCATTPGTATVVYPPGFNMVGGPPSSNFNVVEALFAYDAATNSYTNASSNASNVSSAAPTCTGYFAYFAAALSVNLPASSKTGDTATCALSSGYNLVGNPFASPAKLPSGVTAYHWNGTSYDTVGVIPTGGAVFIYNDGSLNSVTLTAS